MSNRLLNDSYFFKKFNYWASKFPEKIAIKDKNLQYSYAEVFLISKNIAANLQVLGVRSGDKVAIALERSADSILAVLGVLFCGASYIPIDIKLPQERIKYILKDSQAKTLVTNGSEKYKKIVLEVSISNLKKHDENFNINNVSEKNYAYVIYTSGSTGAPKGVVISHKNLNYYLKWISKDFNVSQKDAFDFSSPLSFDFSVTTFLLPLTLGACVHVCRDESKLDPLSYVNYLIDSKISFIKLTPGYFNKLLEQVKQLNKIELPDLHTIFLGGEACISSDIKEWLELFPSHQLVNEYGPTEITVAATAYSITSENVNTLKSSVPIGKAALGASVFLLDNNMQAITQLNTPGEICVAGEGVSSGYLNNNVLTKEKFIQWPHPETNELILIYRTGDKAVWLDESNLDYLGRDESYIKLRGYRVNLLEIERFIHKIDGVKKCVVFENKNMLYCFLQKNNYISENETIISNIKSRIEKNFPNYMHPNKYAIVDAFPLTNNEKIDHKALLDKNKQKVLNYKDPIHVVFADILNSNDINIKKSFIENGGHSLSAIELLLKLRKKHHVNFSISDLLSNISIEKLTENLTNHGIDYPAEENNSSHIHTSSLSSQQQSLVFLESLTNASNYNIVTTVKFHGKINKDKLFLAIHKVININPQLGVRVYIENGMFFQEQHVNLDKLISQSIFSHKLEHKKNIEETEFLYRFDLSKELPIRINFLENNENDSFLIVTWHHIVSDEWSSKVFFKEIQNFYQNDDSRTIPTIKKNTYFNYCVWQQTDSFSTLCKQAIKSFNNVISNESIDLPFDYQKNRNDVLLSKRIDLNFSKAFSSKIRKFCMKKSITPFLLFITLYQVALFRFTWQRNFNIGVPYANRIYPGVEDCIGLFSNSVPFPTDISKHGSFSEQLELNRKLSFLLMENQFLPFKCLVEEICQNREFGENPLFQVMFVYQNNQDINFTLSGVQAEIFDPSPIYAKIPFCLFLKDCGDNFSVTLEFAKNLFEDRTAKSFLLSFKGILESVLQNPSEIIENLNLIPKNKKMLISISSGLEKEYPKDRAIPEIIHDYATVTPNAIAIEQVDFYITYKQLDELSDALAENLIKNGVLAGQVIGIACKRSIEHILGLVAILKLNCTYSPIDINQPEARTSYQINDANINHILVDKDYSRELSMAFDKLKTVIIDIVNLSLIKSSFIYSPKKEVPAYIMYTSGTTGVPKGVVISQKAILCLTINSSNIPISSQHKIAHCSSVCFDASTFEIWSALLNGATLVIACENEMSDFNSIRNFYNKRHIDIAWLTKSLFDEICYFDNNIFSNLKYLIVGGEALNPDTIKKVLYSKRRPKFLINGYGPTEVTTFSCMHIINKKDLVKKNIVPIGKPIDNTEIMLLDQFNHKVPKGFKGKIYISSDRLANGYTKKDLTEKSFINLNGKTWYSSGDLARINQYDDLEFLGREDKQIKLRGFRIERSDIEANILNHPRIKQAYIELIDEKLIAFIVLNEASEGDALRNDIGIFLKKRTPNYMLPADYCFLTHIPITKNGKIDSKLLEKNYLSSSRIVLRTPSTKSEADNKLVLVMFNLWEKVLNHRSFSEEDSFFSVGGNSIKLLLLTHLIYEAFPVKVSIADIMKNDTVKLQVELIKNGQAILGESISEVALVQNDVPPLYLIHPSSGQTLSYQSLNGIIQRSVYAINDPYFLDAEHCYTKISAMAEHYASLILKHLCGNRIVIGGWSFGGLLAIKVAEILKKNNITIANLVLIDTYKSYNKTVFKKIKNNILKEISKTDLQFKKSELLKELQNLSLAFEYKHEPYNGDAVLIRANERGLSLSDELTEFSLKNCGWLDSDFTKLQVVKCKGNHHSLFLHDNVRYLANLLDKI